MLGGVYRDINTWKRIFTGGYMKRFFMHILSAAVLFSLLAFTATAQVKYFPTKSADGDPQLDPFLIRWYSSDLKALEEPSLLELAKSPGSISYRFLWLRTFHNPVAIRLDVMSDGTSILTTKVTNGAGGYSPGKLIVNSTRKLSLEQLRGFLKSVEKTRFWIMPTLDEERNGCDGSEWIIEGVKDGQYHVVTRWSPDSGAVRELGLILLSDLAQMKIPEQEMY
jgi:hypothetical protein